MKVSQLTVYSTYLIRQVLCSRPTPSPSLISRPHPSSHHLPNTKEQGDWYLFSREYDIIGKWQEFQINRLHFVYFKLTTHSMLGVYDIRPPTSIYVHPNR